MTPETRIREACLWARQQGARIIHGVWVGGTNHNETDRSITHLCPMSAVLDHAKGELGATVRHFEDMYPELPLMGDRAAHALGIEPDWVASFISGYDANPWRYHSDPDDPAENYGNLRRVLDGNRTRAAAGQRGRKVPARPKLDEEIQLMIEQALITSFGPYFWEIDPLDRPRLAYDLYDMHETEFPYDSWSYCAIILRQRIGGADVLPRYVRSLS